MTDTSIEWTDKTWNPIRGCALVSHGCTNCYAMKQAHRFSGEGMPYEGLTKMTSHGPVWTGKVRVVPELLDLPLRWTKPRRIFVNSMSDLFHEDVPDSFICAVFAVMETAQRHTFQVLTKRPERMRRLLSHPHFYAGYMRKAGYDIVGPKKYEPRNPGWPLPNVWIGVSVEEQETADERIPILLQTPAAVRWISAEPLLASVDVTPFLRCKRCGGSDGVNCDLGLHWVVVGGESGPGARPMHPQWARSLRDQCTDAGAPFLFKQHGAHAYLEGKGYPAEGDQPAWIAGGRFVRVGKKRAGRTLDGKVWDEYPIV